MVNLYASNDEELTDLQNKVNRLNGEIESYIGTIQDHADRYRQCTS